MKTVLITFVSLLLFALYVTTSAQSSGEQYEKEVDWDFSHQLHVIEMDMTCRDCHAAAEESATGRDNLMPSQSVCLDCHTAEEIGDPKMLPPILDYGEKFSHQQHIASGFECESCHSGITEKTTIKPYLLPKMTDCMSCHESKAVSVECETCHMPGDKLKPISHTPNFTHTHGDMARLNVREMNADMDCATCHKPKFCQDCHEGDNLDRLTHPLNYEFTHSLDAQGKERECAVCHTERQFCVNCHIDNQVLPKNHTAGWVNRIPNDGGRHRVEALNDIEACMACHQQNADQICQACHGQ